LLYIVNNDKKKMLNGSEMIEFFVAVKKPTR